MRCVAAGREEGKELTDEKSGRGGTDALLRSIHFIVSAQGSHWSGVIMVLFKGRETAFWRKVRSGAGWVVVHRGSKAVVLYSDCSRASPEKRAWSSRN